MINRYFMAISSGRGHNRRMGWWGDRIVPRVTDVSLRGRDVGEWRATVCEGLAGQVLELGFGSGLNARWYPDGVISVRAVEPSDLMWEMSGRRRARTAVPVERTGLDGQQLADPDASVDHVLFTFTLCTIPDVARALAEVRRVLRPGGTVRFVEHGVSPDVVVQRWQHRLDGVEQRVAGGCHLVREPVALLGRSGFEVDVLRQDYLPGPAVSRPWTWLTAGVARAARA